MSLRTRLISLSRNIFRRRRVDQDLDAEVRSYLELAIDEKLAAGMDPAAARRAALLELGGVEQVKEEVRSTRAGSWLHDAARDLRHSLRMLGRAPGFTAVAVLTLALGIGANTAIFSVVHGALLRPAPVEDLDGLVMVWETDRNSATFREPASVPDFLDFRKRARGLEAMAAMMAGEHNLVAGASEPRRVAGLSVTHELHPMLGIEPILGRGFTADDAHAAGADVAIISESLWESEFQRDPGVLGKRVDVDEVPHRIVGVMPGAADFGVLAILSSAAYSRSFADRGARTRVDVWTPLRADPASLPRDTHPIFVLGRLGPGTTVQAAQHELAAIAADLERNYPENDGRGVQVEALTEIVFAPVRPALLVLLVTVALVLLIACVNVANLLMARAVTRVREVAVRTALGASLSRLARQFLIEGLLLTLSSAAAGIALAVFALDALLALAPPALTSLTTVTLNPIVFAFTLGVSVVVGVAFGLIPVVHARRVDVQAVLRGTHASAGGGWARLRPVLVVAELALAVMLVAGAGLLVRSFWRVSGVDPGFRVDGVLKAEFQLPASRYPVDFDRWPNFAEIHAFDDRLVARVSALPGVTSVALAGDHPLDPGFTNSFTIEGRQDEARSWPEISIRRITPGYFTTVGSNLRRGRAIQTSDSTAAEPVAIINETAARRFFAGREPLGARIEFWGAGRRIVGIVGDERIHGVTEAAPPAVYVPLAQVPSANGAGVVLVRTTGDPAAVAAALRGAFHDVDPRIAPFGIEPLAETLARSVSQRRFVMLLLGLFALLALALAAVGIHGVLAYSVTQRTREIGTRMALGATPQRMLRQIVGEGLSLGLVGVSVGIAGALALSRVLESLLYATEPTDVLTFVAVAVFMLGVAIAASYGAARQATRVDPMTCLRAE